MSETTLGKRLQCARKKAGFTLKDFAKALDIAYQSLSRYENDQYTPDIPLFLKIATLTKTDVRELLTGIDTEEVEVYNDDEREYCRKLLRIMRTKKESTKMAIKNNINEFLSVPGEGPASAVYEAAETTAAYKGKKKEAQ